MMRAFSSTARARRPLLNAVPRVSQDALQDLRESLLEDKEKRDRNSFFRTTFRIDDDDPESVTAIDKKLPSPFVPTPRDYPVKMFSKYSLREARKHASVLVAHNRMWEQLEGPADINWRETLSLLKQMTPTKTEKPKMSAVRIVLPKSLVMEEVENQAIRFVDSSTGLVSKLRVSADQRHAAAIVIRGRSETLAKAADELVKTFKKVQVFQLGEVAEFDYETRLLWPAIRGAENDGAIVPEDELDKIWVHQEDQEHWLETRYENVLRPLKWTTESFHAYISTMVFGKVKPELAVLSWPDKLKRLGDDGPLLSDSISVRVQLVMDAFSDPAARPCITTSTLKMAVAFMSQMGGHRASADKLFQFAENWGIPMDTDLYNIMLESYVRKRDVVYFYMLLRKMQTRYFYPNARTWISWLQLTQKDDERRQIVVAMYELGLFEDPGTRRGIARVLAEHDAYTAFRSGKKMSYFLQDQTVRYGKDWFTREALDSILSEYFKFKSAKAETADLKQLIEKTPDDGRALQVDNINTILEHASLQQDWELAFWTLHLLPKYGIEANATTYSHLINLAIDTSCPAAFGVIFFYGAVEDKMMGPRGFRSKMNLVLLGRHRNSFWRHNNPLLFTDDMMSSLPHYDMKVSTIVKDAANVINNQHGGDELVEPLAVALERAYHERDVPMRMDRDRKKDEVKADKKRVKAARKASDIKSKAQAATVEAANTTQTTSDTSPEATQTTIGPLSADQPGTTTASETGLETTAEETPPPKTILSSLITTGLNLFSPPPTATTFTTTTTTSTPSPAPYKVFNTVPVNPKTWTPVHIKLKTEWASTITIELKHTLNPEIHVESFQWKPPTHRPDLTAKPPSRY